MLSRLGRYREAERELEVLRQRAVANAFTEMVVALDLVSITYALERRDCATVAREVPRIEQAAGALPGGRQRDWLVLSHLLAGTCAAREGRVGDARQHLAGIGSGDAASEPTVRWWTHALEGEVALAEREYAGASRAFREGEPARKMYFSRVGIHVPRSFLANNLVLRDGRARAAAAQQRWDEAIALYRELLTPGPGQKWTAMLDPLHVIALARVLDKAGQPQAARAEYQRFLDLWKEADGSLPELAEARAALAR